MAKNKTDLDEVRDIRRKRYLKHNKERNERLKGDKSGSHFKNRRSRKRCGI